MWLKSIGLRITQGWLWLFFLNGPLLYTVTAKFGGRPETGFVVFLLFNSISYLLIAKMGRRLYPLGKKPLLLVLGMSLMPALLFSTFTPRYFLPTWPHVTVFR